MTGPGAVKGERMGLFPLAVQELAEEFRRLARGSCAQSNIARVMGATFSATLEEGKAEAYHKAAQMLEKKLNG